MRSSHIYHYSDIQPLSAGAPYHYFFGCLFVLKITRSCSKEVLTDIGRYSCHLPFSSLMFY